MPSHTTPITGDSYSPARSWRATLHSQPLIAEAELHVSGTLAADGTSANLSDAIRLAEELAFVYSLECGRRPVRVVISSPVLLSVDALRSMWHISLVDAAAEAF